MAGLVAEREGEGCGESDDEQSETERECSELSARSRQRPERRAEARDTGHEVERLGDKMTRPRGVRLWGEDGGEGRAAACGAP